MRKTYDILTEAKKYYEGAQTYHRRWMVGRDALYGMCQSSLHDDTNATMSKLWLIGRSHSAALERRQTEGKPKRSDAIYEKTATKMAANGELDKMIAEVKSSGPSYSEARCVAIRDAVDLLTGIFKQTTGQNKRSLASKYLHFHEPAIPILDSLTKNALEYFAPRKILKARPTVLTETPYGAHIARFRHVFESLETGGYKPTARTIDNFLLYWNSV